MMDATMPTTRFWVFFCHLEYSYHFTPLLGAAADAAECALAATTGGGAGAGTWDGGAGATSFGAAGFDADLGGAGAAG